MSSLAGQLRLFSGDDDDFSPPPPRWTPAARLSQIAEAFIRDEMRDADDKTVTALRESLDKWISLTGDPPLSSIDRELLLEFLRRLALCRGKKKGSLLSAATIAKHKRQLQPLFDYCGPRDRKHDNALSILKKAPYFPRPKRARKQTKVLKAKTKPPFTLIEIANMLDAADAATLPVLDAPGGSLIQPGEFWRALMIVLYNTGLRIGSALALRWEWINGGWVSIPGEHYKGGAATDLPFNAYAWEAIQNIRTARETVFPLRGNGVFKGMGRRHLDRQLDRIKRAAGLPADDGRYFHAFRRATALQLTLGSGIDAARFALGHAAADVTKDHYVGGKPAEEYLARLPQPVRNAAREGERRQAEG
ncbi:MAG: tyrosine-type recombinase/integrase [Pirellulales bacterium]